MKHRRIAILQWDILGGGLAFKSKREVLGADANSNTVVTSSGAREGEWSFGS